MLSTEIGSIQSSFTRSGLVRYQVEVRHPELHKYQVIRGDDRYVVEQKAHAKALQWHTMWEKKCAAEDQKREKTQRALEVEAKTALAVERTNDAKSEIVRLEGILAHTLTVDDAVDWESLKTHEDFRETKPKRPELLQVPREPEASDDEFQPKIGFLCRLFPALRRRKEEEAQLLFKQRHDEWVKKDRELRDEYQSRRARYDEAIAAWKERCQSFFDAQNERNAHVERRKVDYLDKDAGAIIDYCDMVLSNSEYLDYFPQTYDLDYNSESGVLIVDYRCPSPSDLPTLREVRYVKSRDDFDEKHLPQSKLNSLYDSVLYQIALRTIHELFEADKASVLSAVVFNGYVHSVDPATGKEADSCVLSVQVGKEEFEEFNLELVEPKSCFRKLKGVGSAKLHSVTPIPPIVRIEREDARFVPSQAVADNIEDGDNLAAMNWEDFEHLIRELFEKEFSKQGGEVRVTRASRDGGIDAVAFDPDPIRGGKIVIQAKRYTRTVDVAAVRDLYGTVMNEGANKGILVTTSDYGPDAYTFAQGKPLTLLNGSNLLHLLQKHGHRAKIDLREAREMLSEKAKPESK